MVPSQSYRIEPLSYKSQGRAHLACLRCRSQKIKCSGDNPCRNCSISGKECKYPLRDRRVVILESQLNKVHQRLLYLEREFGKQNRKIVEPIADSIPVPEIKEEEEEEADLNPLSSHQEVSESGYFGASSCEVFDNALHSFLVELTDINEPGDPSSDEFPRYFLQDPTINSPFTGVVMFPDKEYALMLVNKVIDFLGHEYYLFDPIQFKIEIEEAYERLRDKKPLWICYFLVTLAIGEQYLNRSVLEQNGESATVPGMRFFNPAMQLFKNYYEEPDLRLVQTQLLIAFYCQGLNRTNTAYHFFGSAIRTSLVLGLHRKLTNPSISEQEIEKRKRVWWTCFCMESVWASKLGQPLHVTIDDIDVEFPNESHIRFDDSFNVELLTRNVQLSILIAKIIRNLYRPNDKKGKSFAILSLECLSDLDNLRHNLPSLIRDGLDVSVDRSVANLYLRINQLVIITARPLVLSIFAGKIRENDQTLEATTRCIEAAKNNIDILLNLQNNGWLSQYGFWDSQYCFSALLILIMVSWGSPVKPVQVKTGRDLMTYMGSAGNFTAQYNQQRLKYLDNLQKKNDSRHKKLNEFPNLDEIRLNDDKMMSQILPFLYNGEDEKDFFGHFQNRSNLSPETLNNLAAHFQNWDGSTFPASSNQFSLD